jgi:hypothetical protein
MKSWLIVLTLAGASIAIAKSYSVTIAQPFVDGDTVIESKKFGDQKRITGIGLAGTQIKLVFN